MPTKASCLTDTSLIITH
uniref:Uncharacterized protein n=1 Tax=Arundo donax TaxID=35708 RepID=A0A0A8ZNG4_ARUDO